MNNNEASKRTPSFYCVACGQVFKSQETVESHYDKEHEMKVNVEPEFQRGELDKVIKNLKNLVDIQCSTGNWNYDPYMQGMANGLICALACLTGEEPKYISAPKKWLKDCHVECQSVGEEGQIRQPQQPKKTALKAPAIKCGIVFSGTNHVHGLYRSKEEAQKLLGSDFLSFPAKIRLKDGTDQELWFVCEEES